MAEEAEEGASFSMQDNREIILEALLLYDKGEDLADKLIKSILDKYSFLEKNERSFINRVFSGTIERRLTLDYIINLFSSVKINKQKPVIRNILRMSVYQIFYMDSVPDSASINEAVKLAKKKKFQGLSGFVNGVLRKISASKDSIEFPVKDKGESYYLSIKYSCPEWICEHFINEIGFEKTEAVLINSLEDRPLVIRTNLSKISKQNLIDNLEKEGVKVTDISESEAALIISGYDILTDLSSFNDGLFSVQDFSSQMLFEGVDVSNVHLAVDVCAAPGGKTCHLADKLLAGNPDGEDRRIISRDLTFDKVDRIEENIDRCGFNNISTEVFDALELDEELVDKVDLLVADLPCSGLGVIGRKVDIKYRVKKEDFLELSKLQKEILKVVSQYVKKGGRLIYSTCTVDALENEENVKFIEENLPFKLEIPYTKIINDKPYTDGFFISRFVRV